MVLDYDDILKINTQALAVGLHNKRDRMFFGINIEYVAGLPTVGNPADQLLADLAAMNNDGAIVGGIPLERWLRNAAYAMSVRPDKQQFFREFADKAAKSAALIDGGEPPAHMQQERILFVSDLLPFGFLAGAARTGRSIARLAVPRFEGETQRIQPMSGDPVLFFGTGWLIGPKHLITNYHVINARTDGELPASPAEFDVQARGTQVQFDYDDENAAGEEFTVAALSASNVQLDYALLELNRDAGRPPLPIWARPIEFAEGARLPVNIIQHPGGQPKQIAIRNNLAAALKGAELAYFTDTAGGSSGSPVCNDRWQVLALHKASTLSLGRYNYQGKDTAWVNIGTTIERIVTDLQTQNAGLWAQLGAMTV